MLVYELMQFLSGCASGAKVLIGSEYTNEADVLSVQFEDGEVVIAGKDVSLVFGEGETGEMIGDISRRMEAGSEDKERCLPSRWEVVGPNFSIADKGNLVAEIKMTNVGMVIRISQTGTDNGYVDVFAHEVPVVIECIQSAVDQIKIFEPRIDS
jgi:hypothetical protein